MTVVFEIVLAVAGLAFWWQLLKRLEKPKSARGRGFEVLPPKKDDGPNSSSA